jgi:hypothetical protein
MQWLCQCSNTGLTLCYSLPFVCHPIPSLWSLQVHAPADICCNTTYGDAGAGTQQARVLQDVEQQFVAGLRRADGRTVGLGL